MIKFSNVRRWEEVALGMERQSTLLIVLLKEQYINFRHYLLWVTNKADLLGRRERDITLHAKAIIYICCKYCLWLSSVAVNEWF